MTEPPNDLAAERATLGGCLMKREIALDVAEILRPRDFYQLKHEVVFESILDLIANGHPVDVVSVVDHLLRRGELSRAGGADYVHGLTSAVAVAAQAPYHASIVRDRAVRRRVLETVAVTAQKAATADVHELIEGAREGLDSALGVERQPLVFVGDLIDQIVDDAERPRRVYPSPWQSLDDILGGGFRPGALYTIAARPGIGKSAIALQIAAALADAGPVTFSSLEMPKEELVRRIIAQGVQMPHHLLERGEPMPEIWKAKIEDWKIRAPHSVAIDDRSTVTMTDIRAFVRAVRRPSGRIVGIVVDYLQLMSGAPGASRFEVVSENARQFKLLAREMDCPVIMLSQLNRNSEHRVDKRPTLSDLRDSGAIEQDSDVVMMLYRDPEFEQPAMNAPPLPVPLELNVAKNRHGPTVMPQLMWEGSQMRAHDGREYR